MVRLTDRPHMTLDVYRGVKQQCNNNNNHQKTDFFCFSYNCNKTTHLKSQLLIFFYIISYQNLTLSIDFGWLRLVKTKENF